MMIAQEYEYLYSKGYCGSISNQHIINAGGYLQMQQKYTYLDAFEIVIGRMEKEYAFRKSFLIIRNYVQRIILMANTVFKQYSIKTDTSKKYIHYYGT